MSDGSNYCANRGIITKLINEQGGIEFVRRRLHKLGGEHHNDVNYNILTEPEPTPYNFEYTDTTRVLDSYNISHPFYDSMDLGTLQKRIQRMLDLPPVILLNVSLKNINDTTMRGHWVVLYRTADFRDDCPHLVGIQPSSIAHYDNMERLSGILTKNLNLNPQPMTFGYNIYYPRYQGDCGPDAVRVIMLLYCCWPSRPAAVASPVTTPITSDTEAAALVSALRTDDSPGAASQQATSAVYDSVRRSLEDTDPRLTAAADNMVREVITEIRRSSRIRGIAEAAAAEAALTALENLADAGDKDLINIAVVLLNSGMPSSGASAGSQLSQQLLNIAQSSGILPLTGRKGASEYNSHIQEILSKLGTEYEGLMRDVYTATKDAKAISEPQQFRDVWGEGIAKHVKKHGSCYLSGEDFVSGDSPEMDHVKFATSAFMECIHYRELTKRYLCGTKVSKLWQNFIKTQIGINSLWELYRALNLGKKKKGVRVYSEDAVNKCYTKVFSLFKNFIKIQCNTRIIDDIDIFNYSTRMLKFWLAEFAYALHIFNQAKGGLNLNDPRGITAMYKNVKRRVDNPGGDQKTIKELRNRRERRFTQNNTFIANRAKHLEQIAADFNRFGYGCASNLTRDQVAVPELVSVIILMKQIRNILLYSRIQNDQPTYSAKLVARDINDDETEDEASSEEDILKELQSKIENLQSELTTKTTTMVTKRIHQIKAEITYLENKINKITRSIVPEDLINSRQAIEDLIDLQEETRGLFGTNAEQQREALAAQRQDNSIWKIPITTSTKQDGYSTPPQTSTENYIPGPAAGSDEDGWETMSESNGESNGGSNKKKGGTIKNKRITKKLFASRPRKYTQRRKTTKRLMSRRKRYTRKQKK